MAYVFKLSSVSMPGGVFDLFFTFDGRVGGTVSGTDDEEAMRAIAERERGDVLQCEPRLLAAGQQFGFSAAPFTGELAERCALVALRLATSPSLDDVGDFEILENLVLASKEFAAAKPWTGWQRDRIFVVEAMGPVSPRFEAAVFGAPDDDPPRCGIILYENEGDVKMASSLIDTGDMSKAVRVSSLTIDLVKHPDYAVEAMDRAYGIARVPVPTRVMDSKRVPLESSEVLLLCATLLASAASTSPDPGLEGRGRSEGEGKEVRVRMKPCGP